MQNEMAATSWSATVCRITAVALATAVGVVYLMSLPAGRWPTGHPLSGFSLLANAAMMWLTAAMPPRAPFPSFKYISAALMLTAALFWLLAAFAESPIG